MKNGGDEEIRTPDPLLARQVLSQLSYTPTSWSVISFYIMKERSFIDESRFRQIYQKICFTLRKEVIQPHLPIRLPCYDFTPITDPTFGSCLYE